MDSKTESNDSGAQRAVIEKMYTDMGSGPKAKHEWFSLVGREFEKGTATSLLYAMKKSGTLWAKVGEPQDVKDRGSNSVMGSWNSMLNQFHSITYALSQGIVIFGRKEEGGRIIPCDTKELISKGLCWDDNFGNYVVRFSDEFLHKVQNIYGIKAADAGVAGQSSSGVDESMKARSNSAPVRNNAVHPPAKPHGKGNGSA